MSRRAPTVALGRDAALRVRVRPAVPSDRRRLARWLLLPLLVALLLVSACGGGGVFVGPARVAAEGNDTSDRVAAANAPVRINRGGREANFADDVDAFQFGQGPVSSVTEAVLTVYDAYLVLGADCAGAATRRSDRQAYVYSPFGLSPGPQLDVPVGARLCAFGVRWSAPGSPLPTYYAAGMLRDGRPFRVVVTVGGGAETQLPAAPAVPVAGLDMTVEFPVFRWLEALAAPLADSDADGIVEIDDEENPAVLGQIEAAIRNTNPTVSVEVIGHE